MGSMFIGEFRSVLQKNWAKRRKQAAIRLKAAQMEPYASSES